MMKTDKPNRLHPRVEVNLKDLTLIVNGPYPFKIDLTALGNPADVLDKLLQVSRKPWCDRAMVGEVLAALETACREWFDEEAQGVYCPWGLPREADWKTKEFTNMPFQI